MKILLIGEYNRVHCNLKLGFQSLGQEATVVGLTDGFKKVSVDYEIKNPYEKGILKKMRTLIYRALNIDLLGIHVRSQIKKLKSDLSNYDIVQFINEASFTVDRKSEKMIFDMLSRWNDRAYLLSCGTDYISVNYAKNNGYSYSILTPYFNKKGTKKDYLAALSCLTEEHLALHQHVYNNIEGVISNDIDYHLPLKNHPKYLGMIPHAINVEKLSYETPDISKKLVIFHGINTFNYFKKGNDLFEAALEIIESKYGDSIEVITTRNLPYKDYIEAFNKCHILLDQVFAYDQGYNALEAMAKGKVVFTGAEQEFLDYYGLKEDEEAINALPEVDNLVKKLEWLINNPDEIVNISKRARAFVERHHDHVECARQYLAIWASKNNSD